MVRYGVDRFPSGQRLEEPNCCTMYVSRQECDPNLAHRCIALQLLDEPAPLLLLGGSADSRREDGATSLVLL